ncbi:putative galanin [Candidatus Rhodobacter oscarellae]|uniref:Putative galanin n=1 Tax=Candidatus Rhodobacter oscarellae TaxID=1675527 RepID=A0A0J9GZS6_9RHOB|nr:DUF3137 domain-containing protein [Candidatus Rhodobacter lobularis]KMW58993.1 putative galanin [Candidatus Rhodobacter lobularis]
MDFIERNRIEQGFAPIFQDEVRPRLVALEQQRQGRLALAKRWIRILIGVAVAAVIIMVVMFGDHELILPIVLAVVGFSAFGSLTIWRRQSANWSDNVSEVIMPAICRHVGNLSYDRSGGDGIDTDNMDRLGMLSSFNIANFKDRLEGSYRDTRFVLVKAHLQKRKRSSPDNRERTTTTVFRGLLFWISVPVAAPEPILITRELGKMENKLAEIFSGKSGRGMPNVSFDHPEFEAAFEVYSNDPDAAHRMMPSAFLDSLLTIGTQETDRRGIQSMIAGFYGDNFYMTLKQSIDSFLQMGSLNTPVADMEDDVHAIFADIDMIHRIIDRLHGD